MVINMPAVKRIKTGDVSLIQFEIPEMFRGQLWAMVEKAQTDYWQVKIARPKCPRTTGDKSQNHAGNGFCQQIAIATGNSFEVVKQYTKTEAIGRGYSFETLPDGTVMPISEVDQSTEDAYHWIGQIKQLADELGIRLIEGDEDE